MKKVKFHRLPKNRDVVKLVKKLYKYKKNKGKNKMLLTKK